MTVTAVIAEYNPFHNGHAYHLAEARRRTAADFLIVVMSGDFVQRGEPAIADKYSRAEAAVRAGADLVLELPSCYACASAEYFAGGAVSLLNDLGCVDYLCFGSECGDLTLLSAAADVLAEEPEEYRATLKSALKSGASYPAARQAALAQTLASGTSALSFDAAAFSSNDSAASLEIAAVLSQPNDILGVEYLKALKKTDSRIRPAVIRRTGGGYHSDRLDVAFPSASAIRAAIQSISSACGAPDVLTSACGASCSQSGVRAGADLSDPLCSLRDAVPENVLHSLSDMYGHSFPLFAADFSFALHVKLLSADRWEDYTAFFDVPEALARRIFRLRGEFTDFDSFASLVRTRSFTEAHVRRALLHILLNIPANLPGLSEKRCYYAKILGLRKSGARMPEAAAQEHDAAPVAAQKHGAAPAAVQEHGAAPTAAQERGAVPAAAQERGAAPAAKQAGAADSLLAAIKKNGRLPFLSKPTDAPAVLSRFYSDPFKAEALRALQIDRHCFDLYQAALTAKFGTRPANECGRGIFIL